MKVFTGKVISKKMEKTATVVVERVFVHPVYGKRVKRVKKYHVHDTFGTKVGQKVNFVDCKPVSKTKKWKVIEVVSVENKKPATQKAQRSSQKTQRKTIKKTQKRGKKKQGKTQ